MGKMTLEYSGDGYTVELETPKFNIKTEWELRQPGWASCKTVSASDQAEELGVLEDYADMIGQLESIGLDLATEEYKRDMGDDDGG